jgi:hypothetical protein
MIELKNIKLSEFSLRHFDSGFGGTKILNIEPKDFEEKINHELSLSKKETIVHSIMDGYAPFCKLVSIENFTDAKVGTLPITESNYIYIRHGYSKRREGEFETFSRWIELPVPAPKANYLIIVLYDREQIDKEAIADYNNKLAASEVDSNLIEKPKSFSGEWGIVAILAQNTPEEEPMKAATFDRNYMPIEFGGSGLEYPKIPEKPNSPEYSEIMKKYKEDLIRYNYEMDEIRRKRKVSVDFWNKNVTVK